MIPYETYKIVHLTSLAILLTCFAVQFYGLGNRLHKILSGLATLMVLVSGMGLMARLGIGHTGGWPTWVKVKMIVWGLIGVGGAVVVKRFPHAGRPAYWIMLALFVVAAVSAVEKF